MTAWIFQGNPKKFDIDSYLKRQRTVRWLVRPERFGAEIGRGDRVFMWRADGDRRGSGGVVAVGRTASTPKLMEDDSAPEFWHEQIASEVALRVVISLAEVRLTPKEGMLLRSDVKHHPTLSDLLILRWSMQTTYPLDKAEENFLLGLWNSNR